MSKKYLLALITFMVIAVGIFTFQNSNKRLPITAVVTTDTDRQIKVRVADTDKKRQLGLSYFTSLPEDEGMLFLFDKPGIYPFWMKDMNFPLDIIWLKKTGDNQFQVVHTVENILPSTYPESFVSQGVADAVLEVNSGVSTVYNLAPEKKLWISFKK